MKCHSCQLCSQHPSSPLLWISLCLQMLISFCGAVFPLSRSSMYCHFVPRTVHGPGQTHHNLTGGSPTMRRAFCTPPASISLWWCLITPFLPTGIRELSTARQLLHCHYVCPSLPGSKLLGGEDFPDGHPRKIACWSPDQLQASGLQRRLPHLPSSSVMSCLWWSWVLAKLVLTAGPL